jgi:hypothetical protein
MVENAKFALKLLQQSLFIPYFPGANIYEPETLSGALVIS